MCLDDGGGIKIVGLSCDSRQSGDHSSGYWASQGFSGRLCILNQRPTQAVR
jgi:hypothetical protein